MSERPEIIIIKKAACTQTGYLKRPSRAASAGQNTADGKQAKRPGLGRHVVNNCRPIGQAEGY